MDLVLHGIRVRARDLGLNLPPSAYVHASEQVSTLLAIWAFSITVGTAFVLRLVDEFDAVTAIVVRDLPRAPSISHHLPTSMLLTSSASSTTSTRSPRSRAVKQLSSPRSRPDDRTQAAPLPSLPFPSLHPPPPPRSGDDRTQGAHAQAPLMY